MAIFKMIGDKEKLEKVAPTSFSQERVLERTDLQPILRDQPEVLEDGLLIISEEFSNWEDSNLRIDLLGVDSNGRLTVIELKRGDTGAHMELQAIRYAAMVANMTFEQAVGYFQKYLAENTNGEIIVEGENDAETRLRDHLRKNQPDDQIIHTEIPRIILASEDFGKELTTCVLWLNDNLFRNMDEKIKCIRLQPHRNGGEILIETNVIIPLPEASDYQTQLGKREQETREKRPGSVEYTQSSHAFKESLDRASATFRPGLESLYRCAIDLEQEGLVELSCRIQVGNTDVVNLLLRMPNQDRSLVSFANLLRYKEREVGGEITIHPNKSGLELGSYQSFDQLIRPITSKNEMRHKRLSRIKNLEEVLEGVKEVYREANGL